MTEEVPGNQQEVPEIIWQNVPTVITEQIVGHAVAGAMHRFVLAEVVFNPKPGATSPILRPTVNLAIPHMLLPSIISALQGAFDGVQEQMGEGSEGDGE